MHDAGTVGGFERLGDLDPQRQRLAQRHRAPLEQRAQGFALQVLLHHVVGGAFGPHVVHRGDVWVWLSAAEARAS